MKEFIAITTSHPHLLAEWDYQKNTLDPNALSSGSSKKPWWVCANGHSWEASIANRALSGSGCRICVNSVPRKYPNRKPRAYVVEFSSSLAGSGNKQLIAEWSPNNLKSPSEVFAQSNKKALWVCRDGHEWSARVQNRFMGAGCPICSGFKVLTGYNDLETINPELSSQWHPEKNFPLTPSQVRPYMQKKVWWLGTCGHEWQSTVAHRSSGSGCIYCSGHSVLAGFNDLSSSGSQLLSEWHPSKNKITADEITEASSKKIWWLCQSGHEWEARPSDRKRTGCPECAAKNYVSTTEKELFDLLLDYVPDLYPSYRKFPNIVELDMYSPSKNIAIEFNGLFWHSEACKPKNYHYDKMLACADNGVSVINVWEDDWRDRKEIVIQQILSKFGVSQQEKISARECHATIVTKDEALLFLEANHIQGGCIASAYLGLMKKDGSLCAVLAITKLNASSSIFKIDRYASNANVRGGFTKLLSFAEREFPVSEWQTFADNMHSDGNLYSANGFEISGQVAPDYKYHYKNKRVHKFNFRKDRIKKNPDLKYIDGLTELELTKLNNIHRIWDSGKTKYTKKVVNNE